MRYGCFVIGEAPKYYSGCIWKIEVAVTEDSDKFTGGLYNCIKDSFTIVNRTNSFISTYLTSRQWSQEGLLVLHWQLTFEVWYSQLEYWKTWPSQVKSASMEIYGKLEESSRRLRGPGVLGLRQSSSPWKIIKMSSLCPNHQRKRSTLNSSGMLMRSWLYCSRTGLPLLRWVESQRSLLRSSLRRLTCWPWRGREEPREDSAWGASHGRHQAVQGEGQPPWSPPQPQLYLCTHPSFGYQH